MLSMSICVLSTVRVEYEYMCVEYSAWLSMLSPVVTRSLPKSVSEINGCCC